MTTRDKTERLYPEDYEDPVVRSMFYGIGKMWVLLPAAFITSLGLGISSLGLIFYINNVFGAGPQVTGLFGSVWFIAYLVGCFALQPLGRKILPRWSLLGATISMSLTCGLILAAKSLPLVFALYAAFGFVTALFWPPLMGWLSQDMEGKELAKASARFNVSWSLGGVLAPFTGGLLAEVDPIMPAIVAVACFALCGAFIFAASLLLPRIRQDNHLAAAGESSDGKDESTKVRFASWIGVASAYMLMGIVFNVFPVYAKNDLGLSESATGFILLLRALVTMAGFTALGKLHFWHFKPKYIFAVQFSRAILAIAMGFAGNAIALSVAIALAGAVLAFMYTSSLFHGASGARHREKRMMVHEVVLTSGNIFGSVMGGFLYQNVSMSAAFWVLGGLFIVGGAAQMITQAESTQIPKR